MTCKYFKTRLEAVQEVDGSMIPSFVETSYCELGRDEVGMIPKYTATPYNGLCWQDEPQQKEGA